MKSEQKLSDCQYSFILLVHLGIVLFGIALFSAGSPAHADTTIIENNISVTSRSGGNSANGQAGTNGTSTSSVYIKQTVNGNVIEEIDETVQSNDEWTSIRVESTYENGNKETSIEVSPDPEGVSRTETIRVLRSAPEATEEEHESSSLAQTETATQTEHLTRHEEETMTATTTSSDNSDQSGVWHEVTNFFASVLTYVFSLFTESHSTDDQATAWARSGSGTSVFERPGTARPRG